MNDVVSLAAFAGKVLCLLVLVSILKPHGVLPTQEALLTVEAGGGRSP